VLEVSLGQANVAPAAQVKGANPLGEGAFDAGAGDEAPDATEQWADDIRQQRHIGDFRRWKEHDEYRGLQAG
jgi:hypothetical protein